MTAEEQIKRITQILREHDFRDFTRESMDDEIELSTISDIKDAMWEYYCFVSDVCDTLNM